MTEEEQKTDEVFKKFKEGFEEVFEGDLLFKTLRDHGVTVETDVNNWDETSCRYPRYSPDLVGSHGNLKIIRENEDFKSSENGQYVVQVNSKGNAFSARNRYGYSKLSDDNCLREGKALGSVFATIFRKVLLSALKEYGKLLEEYKDGIYLKKNLLMCLQVTSQSNRILSRRGVAQESGTRVPNCSFFCRVKIT